MAQLPKRRTPCHQMGCWVGGVQKEDDTFAGEYAISICELGEAVQQEPSADVAWLVGDMLDCIYTYEQWWDEVRAEVYRGE